MSADQPQPDLKPIVIIGAGENADIAYEYFTHDSARTIVGFAVEAEYRRADEHQGLPLIDLADLPERFPSEQYDTFVAISSTQLNRVRQRLFQHVKALGYTCASYVSSHAFVWHNVHVGENTFIFEANVVQHHVEIGDNVVLWSGNHIGHRTRIGDHAFLSSHVVVSGYCTIGEYTFMGVNSCVGDGVTIERDNVVGAGAVVVKDLPARGVYVGNPAKPTGRDSFDSFGVAQ